MKSLKRDPLTQWKRMMEHNIESIHGVGGCTSSVVRVTSGSADFSVLNPRQENYSLEGTVTTANSGIENEKMAFKFPNEFGNIAPKGSNCERFDQKYNCVNCNIQDNIIGGGEFQFKRPKICETECHYANLRKNVDSSNDSDKDFKNVTREHDVDGENDVSGDLAKIEMTFSNCCENSCRPPYSENSSKSVTVESEFIASVSKGGSVSKTLSSIALHSVEARIGIHKDNQAHTETIMYMNECANFSDKEEYSVSDEHETVVGSHNHEKCTAGVCFMNIVEAETDYKHLHKLCENTKDCLMIRTRNHPFMSGKAETRNLNNEKVGTRALSNVKLGTSALGKEKVQTRALSNEKVRTRTLSNEKVRTRAFSSEKVGTKVLRNENVKTRELTNEKDRTRELCNNEVRSREQSKEKVRSRSLKNKTVGTRDLSYETVSSRNLISNEKVKTKKTNKDEVQCNEKARSNKCNYEKVRTMKVNDKKVIERDLSNVPVRIIDLSNETVKPINMSKSRVEKLSLINKKKITKKDLCNDKVFEQDINNVKVSKGDFNNEKLSNCNSFLQINKLKGLHDADNIAYFGNAYDGLCIREKSILKLISKERFQSIDSSLSENKFSMDTDSGFIACDSDIDSDGTYNISDINNTGTNSDMYFQNEKQYIRLYETGLTYNKINKTKCKSEAMQPPYIHSSKVNSDATFREEETLIKERSHSIPFSSNTIDTSAIYYNDTTKICTTERAHHLQEITDFTPVDIDDVNCMTHSGLCCSNPCGTEKDLISRMTDIQNKYSSVRELGCGDGFPNMNSFSVVRCRNAVELSIFSHQISTEKELQQNASEENTISMNWRDENTTTVDWSEEKTIAMDWSAESAIAVDSSAQNDIAVDWNAKNTTALDLNSENMIAVGLSAENTIAVDLSTENTTAVDLSVENTIYIDCSAENIVGMDLGEENTVAIDLSEENTVAIDLNEENPVAVDLSEENPVAIDLSEENPVAIDLSEENPVAIDLNEENPVAVDLNEENPVSIDLSEENPVAIDFSEENAITVNLSAENTIAVNSSAEYTTAVNSSAENTIAVNSSAENTIAIDCNEMSKCQIIRVKQENIDRCSNIDSTDGKMSGILVVRTESPCTSWKTEYYESDDSMHCLEKFSERANELQPSNLKESTTEGSLAPQCKANKKCRYLTRNPMTQWKRLVDINLETVFNKKSTVVDNTKYAGGDFEASLLRKTTEYSSADDVLEKPAMQLDSSLKDFSVLNPAERDLKKCCISHSDTQRPEIVDCENETIDKYASMTEFGNCDDHVSLDVSEYSNAMNTETVDYKKLCNSEGSTSNCYCHSYTYFGEEDFRCSDTGYQSVSERYVFTIDKSIEVAPKSLENYSDAVTYEFENDKNCLDQDELYDSDTTVCNISYSENNIPPFTFINNKAMNRPIVNLEVTASLDTSGISNGFSNSKINEEISVCSLRSSKISKRKCLSGLYQYTPMNTSCDVLPGKAIANEIDEIDIVDSASICKLNLETGNLEVKTSNEIAEITSKCEMNIYKDNLEQAYLTNSHEDETNIKYNLWNTSECTQFSYGTDSEQLNVKKLHTDHYEPEFYPRVSSLQNTDTEIDVGSVLMTTLNQTDVNRSSLTVEHQLYVDINSELMTPACQHHTKYTCVPTVSACIETDESCCNDAKLNFNLLYNNPTQDICHIETNTLQSPCIPIKVDNTVQDKYISGEQTQLNNVKNRSNYKEFHTVIPEKHTDTKNVVGTVDDSDHHNAFSRTISHQLPMVKSKSSDQTSTNLSTKFTLCDPNMNHKIEVLNELCLSQDDSDTYKNKGWSRFYNFMTGIFRGSKEVTHVCTNVNKNLNQEKKQINFPLTNTNDRNIDCSLMDEMKKTSICPESVTCESYFLSDNEENINKTLKIDFNKNVSVTETHEEQVQAFFANINKLSGGVESTPHNDLETTASDLLKKQTNEMKVRRSNWEHLTTEINMKKYGKNLSHKNEFEESCTMPMISENDKKYRLVTSTGHNAIYKETLCELPKEYRPTSQTCSGVREMFRKNKESDSLGLKSKDSKIKVSDLESVSYDKRTTDISKIGKYSKLRHKEEDIGNGIHKNNEKIKSNVLKTDNLISNTGCGEQEQRHFFTSQKKRQRMLHALDNLKKNEVSVCEKSFKCEEEIETVKSISEIELSKVNIENCIDERFHMKDGTKNTCRKIQLTKKPVAVKEKLAVSTDTISNEAALSEYLRSTLKAEQVLDSCQYIQNSCRDGDLLQSSLECLLEMLLQRGKVIRAVVANIQGEVIAKTANFDFTKADIKVLICSISSTYKGMVKISIFNDVYTCFKHDQDSSLIGRAATGIFVAHRGRQSIVIGISDPKSPGSCIKEIQEISTLLHNRGL